MSFEYSAHARLTTADVVHLAASLPNAHYVLVSAPTATQLLLRFGGRPPREEWLEDIDLRFGDIVYAAIHGGTESERSEFLRHLAACLGELGYTCDFEEG